MRSSKAGLSMFLVALGPHARAAFSNELQDVICDAFATSPEAEHEFAHRLGATLCGGPLAEPELVGYARAAALSDAVTKLSLMLRIAYTVPRGNDPPSVAAAVIALARRRGLRGQG